MAGSSRATACRRSAALPMSARSRSRPRAASTLNCCAAALPTQSVMIARSLAGLERPEVLDLALRHSTTAGTQAARTISAEFLAREDWSPAPDQLVFTANGRQCIAAALAAMVPSGGRCGVEALTYPFIKDIAARLGVTLVPLAMAGKRTISVRTSFGRLARALHAAPDGLPLLTESDRTVLELAPRPKGLAVITPAAA